MRILIAVALVAACGGAHRPVATSAATPVRAPTGTDRLLPLLPDGAQLVVELDLARLRKNPVVGEVATRALAQVGNDARLPGLPFSVEGSPLAGSDAAVIATYGLGTHDAATVTVLATKADVSGATRLAPDIIAIGPDAWVSQVRARATIAGYTPDGTAPVHADALVVPEELARLRDHAMPGAAPGATLRITARLPFDARVAIARNSGVEIAPARLSIWGDVVDDLAIIIDADAVDPGDRAGKEATRHLAATIRTALAAVADLPAIRALGVPNSLLDARLVAQGTWVRAIIVVDPSHLTRVVQRVGAMLGPS